MTAPRAAWALMRIVGDSRLTEGRSPVRSRNWSTTASFTRCAPNWVCVTPGTAPEKSTISVPVASMCVAQSISRTPA